jgi:hypothetical protein
MNIVKITSLDRKWYEIILWWEVRRIVYNILMYFTGLLSFQIAFITIPLIYIVIGLALNVFYTFGWVLELMLSKGFSSSKVTGKFSRYAFFLYLIASMIFVLGLAIFLKTF